MSRVGTEFNSARAVDVSKTYGRQRALSGISMELNRGRVTALLGPNGSGKTTLLMLFSTLSRPSSGKILFGDLPEKRVCDARGRIGLLSHATMTYGELSALENLEFFGRLYQRDDVKAEAITLIERFELTPHMNRPVNTFSRGMLQRLGLARALIGQPSLLLLDEPFTGLDRNGTQTVVNVVKAHRDQGGLALMISHDLNVAAKLGDEFVVLKRGRQVADSRQSMDASTLRDFYAEATA